MKELTRTQFGEAILRQKAEKLKPEAIQSKEIRRLIADMRYTLTEKKLGVGLAAPQVGQRLALTVIAVRPSEHRPKVKPFDLVLINPEITGTTGRRKQLWEGCISAGSHGKADLFAKVPRYPQVKVKYRDEQGKLHHRGFKGLAAHIIQHEVDHLNGVLFVDRVKDPTTYMTYKQYLRMVKQR